jgi:hypothetical protein
VSAGDDQAVRVPERVGVVRPGQVEGHLNCSRYATPPGEAWQALLDAYRVRMRRPYRIQHLTTSMAALLNGFHINSIVRPDGLGDPAGEPGWSLVTRTAVALFEQLTEESEAVAPHS